MTPPRRDPVGPGQESVWDYPRPPRVERAAVRIVVELGGRAVVDTDDVLRVLETSHPPVYYLPAAAFVDGALVPTAGATVCEFKGQASYLDIHGGAGEVARRGAWTYPDPAAGMESLRDRVAVYAARVDRCTVDGETVVAQQGEFYGGWITSRVTGPFKGALGTTGW